MFLHGWPFNEATRNQFRRCVPWQEYVTDGNKLEILIMLKQ